MMGYSKEWQFMPEDMPNIIEGSDIDQIRNGNNVNTPSVNSKTRRRRLLEIQQFIEDQGYDVDDRKTKRNFNKSGISR